MTCTSSAGGDGTINLQLKESGMNAKGGQVKVILVNCYVDVRHVPVAKDA